MSKAPSYSYSEDPYTPSEEYSYSVSQSKSVVDNQKTEDVVSQEAGEDYYSYSNSTEKKDAQNKATETSSYEGYSSYSSNNLEEGAEGKESETYYSYTQSTTEEQEASEIEEKATDAEESAETGYSYSYSEGNEKVKSNADEEDEMSYSYSLSQTKNQEDDEAPPSIKEEQYNSYSYSESKKQSDQQLKSDSNYYSYSYSKSKSHDEEGPTKSSNYYIYRSSDDTKGKAKSQSAEEYYSYSDDYQNGEVVQANPVESEAKAREEKPVAIKKKKEKVQPVKPPTDESSTYPEDVPLKNSNEKGSEQYYSYSYSNSGKESKPRSKSNKEVSYDYSYSEDEEKDAAARVVSVREVTSENALSESSSENGKESYSSEEYYSYSEYSASKTRISHTEIAKGEKAKVLSSKSSYSSEHAKAEKEKPKVPPVKLLSREKVPSETQTSEVKSSSTSSLSVDTPQMPREYLVVRAPELQYPKFFTPPSESFTPDLSVDDMIGKFIDQVLSSINRSESQEGALTAFEAKCLKRLKNLPSRNSDQEVKPEMKHPRCRALRSALRALNIGHVKRKELISSLMKIEDTNSLSEKLRELIELQVREKFLNIFINFDMHKNGEMPLRKVIEILHELGIGYGPVVECYRIRIDCKDSLPVLVVDHLGQLNPVVITSSEYFNIEAPFDWGEKGTLPVHFNTSEALLSVGEKKFIFSVQAAESIHRLKKYCVTFAFLCNLIGRCSFLCRKGETQVLYPSLLRGLIGAMTAPNQQIGCHSILISNAFISIFSPFEGLAEYSPLPIRLDENGEMAVESALAATVDSEEKKRRNIIPRVINTQIVAEEDEAGISVELLLKKVRIRSPLPEGCRPFCLVSVVSNNNTFLPAIEVPVSGIKPSSKEGYTWMFGRKSSEEEYFRIFINGMESDRLYVECCYEDKDTVTVNGKTRTEHTIWCAGYSSTPLKAAGALTLAVSSGSLLEGASAEEVVHKKPFFGCVKKKAEPATGIKVSLSKASKDSQKIGRGLFQRSLLFKRHLGITVELRSAIKKTAKYASTAFHVLHHQHIRKAFCVYSNTRLLDDLKLVWTARKGKLTKNERKFSSEKVLLQCAASVAAAYNCSPLNVGNMLGGKNKFQLLDTPLKSAFF